MTDKLVIFCMKWGPKYGPEYVNRLAAGVKKNLSLPHRFVCLTEEPKGINPSIEILPLPNVGLPKGSKERGWNKLGVFDKSMSNLGEIGLFLDLDLIIVGSIDELFHFPGEFCIIKDWVKAKPAHGNSSVFRFKIGAYPHLLEKFGPERKRIQATYRNEQEYVTAEAGPAPTWWPSDWCVSFKRHAIPKGFAKLWKPPRPPKGAKIIVFHGKPNPPEAIEGKSGKWFRPIRPSPWIKDFWME